MSSIPALSAISTLPATSTVSRARALVTSNAPAVTQGRGLSDDPRRQSGKESTAQGSAVGGDDARVGDGSAGRSAAASRRASAYGTGNAGSGSDSGTATDGQGGSQADGNGNGAGGSSGQAGFLQSGPSSTFVAQSLFQETLGSGLHIEPWSAALGAYRRADGLNAGGSTRSVIL
jgi:hypothetical protein